MVRQFHLLGDGVGPATHHSIAWATRMDASPPRLRAPTKFKTLANGHSLKTLFPLDDDTAVTDF